MLATIPNPSHVGVESLSAAEAREQGHIPELGPEASEETLRAFSYSEMKLYKHAMTYKWTVDELISTIKLIKSTDFKVGDVNVDLHRRVAAAIAKGSFSSHKNAGKRSGWRSGPDFLESLVGGSVEGDNG